MGLDVADDELLTPLRSVLQYLKLHSLAGPVFLFATDAAHEYLLGQGMHVLDGEGATRADAVFVAHADAVDFVELERAARLVLGGARLLTASYAPAYAGANGPILSRGAMLTAALAKATGARPVVVGKPSRAALETISERLGAAPEELAVIGDDVAMDIALGRLGGARTILVATGISGRLALEGLAERRRPHAVVSGIADLLPWL